MNIFWKKNDPELINFDTMIYAIRQPDKFIIINVLPLHEQDCLISGTIDAWQEEIFLNQMIQSITTPDKKIIVYGKHCNDKTIDSKITQLQSLGLHDIFVYKGGLFEWMLLQDIYGDMQFSTTRKVLDLLRFKPTTIIL
jgi:hypothetical protein